MLITIYVTRILTPSRLIRIYSFADQVMVSMTSFLLTIYIARVFSNEIFGMFGLSLAIVLSMQSFQKGLYVVPLSLTGSLTAHESRGSMVVEHILFIITSIIIISVFSFIYYGRSLFYNNFEIILSLFGVSLLYLQQDFDRAMILKFRSTRLSFVFSLITLLAIALDAAFFYFIGGKYTYFMTSLVAIFMARGFVLMVILDLRPDILNGLRLTLSHLSQNGLLSLIGAGVFAGFTQVPVMLLAYQHGNTAVAVLVAMRSVTQPLMVMIRGFDAVDKNSLSMVNDERERVTLFWQTLLRYAVVGIAFTVLITTMSSFITKLLFHDKYENNPIILMGWLSYCTILALTMPTQSMIYAMNRQRDYLICTALAAVVGLSVALLLIERYSAIGAILSTLAGIFTLLASGLWILRKSIVPLRGVRRDD